jgi:hypothetical protein
MTTKEEGIYGEAKILAKFIELGVPVSIPFGDNCSYDLVAEFGGKLNKIQVKTSSQTSDGSTKFKLTRTRINTRQNITKHYTSDEVDYYALYSIVRDKVFLVKFCNVGISINIRYKLTDNGQDHLARFEDDYLMENVLKQLE